MGIGAIMARVNLRRVAGAVGIAGISIVVGAAVPYGGLVRTLVATATTFFLVVSGLKAPRILLIALVGWLVSLGLLRRLLSGVSAAPTSDPLLLVAAVVWSVLGLMAIRRGAIQNRSRFAGWVLAFTCLLIVSAANPLQGSLLVGLGGILLVVAPMSAFWVGRSLVNEWTQRVLIRFIGMLSCGAAVYGLIQTFVGLPSWDQRWVNESGYTALLVGNTTRAFASFSSASEYSTFLGLGIISWLAFTRRRASLPLFVAPSALLAIAIWFESSRGIIVLLVASLAIMLCASRGVSLRRSVFVMLAVLGAIPFVVARVTPAQFTNSSASQLAAHQVKGLADPFGQASSLPGHITGVTNGARQAISNPLGRGVGSVTIAAGKFGRMLSGTESDPGNAAIAAGILGLIAYLYVFVSGFGCAYELARSRRDPISLAVLGMICVTFLQWLNGGQYAVAFVPWLLLGWVDATLCKYRLPVMRATSQSPA